jgi:YcaO-like protein with predicted kinase domain
VAAEFVGERTPQCDEQRLDSWIGRPEVETESISMPTVAGPEGAGPTVKAFRQGTHRWIAPIDTLKRSRRLQEPLGITRAANVTGLDCIGIPVVMVCRPNARSLAVSQGKGLDLEAARASGLMESIELYHAERITLPLKLASFNELRCLHDVARIDGLPLISISAFHPNRTLLWIQGIDVFNSMPTWVPYELVHMNYTVPFPTGSGCFVMSSNGLASGNHALEAVSHGLCEVIERDAVTLFRFRSGREQAEMRVILDSIKDPDCRSVLEQYKRAGVTVGVWDATSDVGVATFRCVILDADPNPFRQLGPVEGMGTHPVREVSLLRALTEAAQGRLTLIAGSRDDNGRTRYGETRDPGLVQRARERLSQPAVRRFDETPTYVNDTFEEDVKLLLDRLRHVGLEQAIVVDLTKPEFGVPVVRVVVPGLETYHHVQGYVPGLRARRLLQARMEEAQQ